MCITGHQQLVKSGPEDSFLIINSLLIVLWLCLIKFDDSGSFLRRYTDSAVMCIKNTVDRLGEIRGAMDPPSSTELNKSTVR